MVEGPVAVLEGRPPQQIVCVLTGSASARRVAGMTRLEAESIAGLELLARSIENEAVAHAVSWKSAALFTAYRRESRGTACSALLIEQDGIEALGRLRDSAQRLRGALRQRGFASISRSAQTSMWPG